MPEQERLATDPETGMVLPNPAKVAPKATIPDAPPDHEWIYPYSIGPHYHSQNAGPWCVLVSPAACMQSPSGMYHIAERQSFACSHLAFLTRRRSRQLCDDW